MTLKTVTLLCDICEKGYTICGIILLPVVVVLYIPIYLGMELYDRLSDR